ncbi:FAD-binding oxidoreductase [Stieleria varia]|uniref:Flavohemoprotein n=1 Tax=Stieleria varia TaxID=2528005 RepID=A0A5C6B1R8_9BACT|nr:FAD-binding oxidoreductase [Stieleria varia]TWU05840.1 Flavohemoprotein [Stieleria varia]
MLLPVLITVVASIVGHRLFAEIVTRHEESCWRKKTREYYSAVARQSAVVRASQQSSSRITQTVQNKPADLESVQNSDRWKGWRRVGVKSIVDESPDCRSFVFAPLDGKQFPRFLGGQSILVQLSDPSGKPVSRCYSLSSGPDEPHYRITVKRVPGGKLSNLLHDTIRVGDEVEIQSPRGRFHYSADLSAPLNLIAAGIGITPMVSMLFQSLSERLDREVNLFYQLRDASNAPFLAPLRRLADSLPETCRFRLHVWYSRPSAEDVGYDFETGRITAEKLLEQLGHEDGEFLLCGPNEFMTELASGLVVHGVNESKVKFESFGGKLTGPGAIAVPASDITQSTTTGQSFQVQFSGSEKTATWVSETQTLLDIAEQLEIPVTSGCRAGDCGACIQKLNRGSVRYLCEPECEVEPGDCVLCIAHPTSDVEIDA